MECLRMQVTFDYSLFGARKGQTMAKFLSPRVDHMVITSWEVPYSLFSSSEDQYITEWFVFLQGNGVQNSLWYTGDVQGALEEMPLT